MTDTTMKDKWDAIYADKQAAPAASRVVQENAHLLPSDGVALEVACGLGGNALLLAERGLRTDAWDISPVAVERLEAIAMQRHLPLSAKVCDVMASPPAAESYDVIVVTHFLERDLMPALLAALKPGGLLFYQTFSQSRVDDSGPRNPAFRLAENELLGLCKPLRLLVYRDEGAVGDTSKGFRNLALLVGQKIGD